MKQMNDKYINNDRVFDQYDNQVTVDELDLEKGYLKPDKILIKYHEAIPEVPREFHYGVKTFYFDDGTKLDITSQDDPHVVPINIYAGVFDYLDQGEGKNLRGIDLEEIEDVERQEEVSSWHEWEEIKRYVPYTEEELKQIEKNKQAQLEREQKQAEIEALPERVTGIETTQDDMVLLLADIIGGAI